MPAPVRHLWLTGPRAAALPTLADPVAAVDTDPPTVVDADRRLRGPYTGAGALLRRLVPALHPREQALLARHAIEILAAAPELEPLVGPAPGTLTSLADDEERTRWYSPLRTRRIAHGLVDLLRARAELPGAAPTVLVLRNADHADATDLEFLALALRRLDPARVRIVLTGEAAEPPEALREAVARYAETGRLTTAEPEGAATAREFVRSDGTLELPAAHRAYLALPAAERARLHDERAEELEGSGEWSTRLGALPHHRERGSAPHTAGVRAYAQAAAYCVGMGFYHAGLELAERLAALAEEAGDLRQYAVGRSYTTQCLALLDRPAETEQHYVDLLARSTNPQSHMSIHYALSMLYTRLYGPEHKDHRRALAYANTAVAIAELLPDPVERAFHAVFFNNGKALVQVHLKNLPAALELVTDGIARLERELTPDQHRLHRSVLHHNRSQVLAGLGREEEALAELTRVIEMDPHYPEYHFDRGNLHFQLGLHQEALADYESAIRLSPPFPEVHFNRGSVLGELGDVAGALADFQYVLDLEPDHTDARVSAASLLLDCDRPREAAEQAALGLELTPDQARLHCTLGLALLELDDPAGAVRAFDRALELDPDLAQARVNRAVVAHAEGRLADALADLGTAIEQTPEDGDIRYNRGYALESADRWQEAAADYTAALELGADPAELLFRRGRCHARLGETARARADLTAHLTLGPSEYAQEAEQLLAALG
ncbi:tetratricopeptide repeat protein [Kitasatospora viridis]|uniref:Tetratricopeptide repeat protein n=1 Tax=Kitasatospora viridis TaxID=281105 RepID=A0A561T6K8_9ACTN|nr:tetratricopeptide repeat protein [Kitasatospora viridis]TWF82732.1 tetratricopeptide repeat protein [Kitasatospora viridis]